MSCGLAIMSMILFLRSPYSVMADLFFSSYLIKLYISLFGF